MLDLTLPMKIWRHIQPMAASAADVFVELKDGQGLLRLRLEFDTEASTAGRASTISSFERPQFPSPSRFSLRAQRTTSDDPPQKTNAA